MQAIPSYLLILLGFTQMLAATLGITSLQFLAASWLCSPLPKVFCCSRGLETFSSTYKIYWRTEAGIQAKEISKKDIALLQGPYLRRNVIGALFSHGPALYDNPRTQQLWIHAWNYYNFKDSFLTKSIQTTSRLILEVTPKKGQSPDLPLVLQNELENP
jgi:hypothetical protein